MRRFEGFKPEFVENLRALRQEGKTWTETDRKSFRQNVYQPCIEFLETLIPALQRFLVTQISQADITDCWIPIGEVDGVDSTHIASPQYAHLCLPAAGLGRSHLCLHLIFSPAGFGLGCGIQDLSAHQKEKLNTALSSEKKMLGLESALAAAEKGGCFLETSMSTNREEKTPRALYFSSLTGLIIRNRNEPYTTDFFDPAFSAIIQKRLKNLIPFEKWLATHVL